VWTILPGGGGLIVVRELDQRLGLGDLIGKAEAVDSPRRNSQTSSCPILWK
jgi:hypothetical protein